MNERQQADMAEAFIESYDHNPMMRELTPYQREALRGCVAAMREKVAREEAAKPREPIPWGALQCWADWAAEQVGCDGSHERERGRNVSAVLRVVEDDIIGFLRLPERHMSEAAACRILAALDKARTPEV